MINNNSKKIDIKNFWNIMKYKLETIKRFKKFFKCVPVTVSGKHEAISVKITSSSNLNFRV